MESHSPKLSLHLSPPWLAGDRTKDPDKSSELRDYISRLEAELRKIEAFKRELPLSVRLFTDAIARLKNEVKDAKPACNFDEIASAGSENDDDGDKRSWMSSAQLWSSDQTLSLQPNLNKPRDEECRQACESSDKGGAFSSFHDVPVLSPAKEPEVTNKVAVTKPSLCLVTSEPADIRKKLILVARPEPAVTAGQVKPRYQPPPSEPVPAMQGGQRKQRRCWSAELHRRFIDALDRLGGPQVATPKQIRELMQVSGLTNDEVKSHLQKYRLHIRKLPSSGGTRDKLFLAQDSGSGGGSTSGAVNGVASSKTELNQSGSPEGPFHLTIRSAAKCNSPASRCDSMEDDYQEKSDSHSWGGD